MKTLTAFYDLSVCPVSFDFVAWLVRARMQAQQQGCQGLHVVIVPNEGGLGGFARHWGEHDAADTRWRLWHIVIPACALAGATVTLAHSVEQAKGLQVCSEFSWWPDGKPYYVASIIDALRAGKPVPKLRATEAARRYVARWMQPNAITVTVRDQTTDASRNSSTDWARFVAWLRVNFPKRDIEVLYDSNKVISNGSGYGEIDIDLRMAMYGHAAMNIIGNNGPHTLLWFSDMVPYMMFNAALPAGPWATHWQLYQHMETGDQVPGAATNQRTIYRPDTLEIMKEEFIKWASATL